MSTTTQPEKMSFAGACNKYFGRLPNQTMSEFSAEIKKLTPDDREEFKREFLKVGIEVTS